MFLRHYFGEDDGTVCGLCDFCLGREGRPSTFFAPLIAPEPLKRHGTTGKRGAGRKRSTGSTAKRRGRRRPASKKKSAGAATAVREQDAATQSKDGTAPKRKKRRRRRRSGRRPTGATGQVDKPSND